MKQPPAKTSLEVGIKAKEEFDKQLRIIIQDTYKEELLKALADQKADFKKKFISFFNEECKSCEGYLGQGEIMWREFEEL